MSVIESKRRALIIANSTYSDPKFNRLLAPPTDAKSLAAVLERKDIGEFEVKVLLDNTSYEVEGEIEEFYNSSKNNDLLLLYFSCHGHLDDENQFYFIMKDTNLKRLNSTSISSSFINKMMNKSKTKSQVLLLDCCYSGSIAKGWIAKSNESIPITGYFEKQEQGKGKFILTSSDAFEFSFERDDIDKEIDKEASIFTHSIIQGLKTGSADLDNDGLISLEDLYQYTYENVRQITSSQKPKKFEIDIEGNNLIIAKNIAIRNAENGKRNKDEFQERVKRSSLLKKQIQIATQKGIPALKLIEESFDIKNLEDDVVISLFLAYRNKLAWNEMISLVDKMGQSLAETELIQEQLALGLNRIGQIEKAEKTILELIDKRGGSSDTYGILGRIYKDRWERERFNEIQATELLDKAIDSYLKGFEMNWRDSIAYPGINAVTLMEIKNPPDERRKKILPIIRYAVEKRIITGKADYWDYATLLELATLAKDKPAMIFQLGKVLSFSREMWEVEVTRMNLVRIKEARKIRNEPVKDIESIIRKLENHCKNL